MERVFTDTRVEAVFLQPWAERYPTAVCRDDSCWWKHSGVDLAEAQRKGEEHVRDSGHIVCVNRQMSLDIEPAPEEAA